MIGECHLPRMMPCVCGAPRGKCMHSSTIRCDRLIECIVGGTSTNIGNREIERETPLLFVEERLYFWPF